MVFDGQCLSLKQLEGGIVELNFDLKNAPVNKLNKATLSELAKAIDVLLEQAESIKGLLITSAKKYFIVGADITEFLEWFKLPEQQFSDELIAVHKTFAALEDLPFPTVSAINGMALGGGFELPLSSDFRVMSDQAMVGLPEVSLGIFPGWGGSIRLPRLIGLKPALVWITGGKPQSAEAALEQGAVDQVVAADQLREAALACLQQCIEGELDYAARRELKKSALALAESELNSVIEATKNQLVAKLGPHYPAPLIAVEAIATHASMTRDAAMPVEVAAFVKAAKTEVANSLVGLYLNDQALKKAARNLTKDAQAIESAAVLGAGVMGGGIAYQSALKGVPIVMKDINQAGIDLGLKEANKLLSKRVDRGQMRAEVMSETLSRIKATLDYDDLANSDIVVEAVIENEKVKKSVLAELEGVVSKQAILASNTSTISITELATATKHPERVCGMHFFNPVPVMPLVEVIRGEKTSDETIARTVAYAQAIGKNPIVVNDCPGFLVNRVLFPYLNAFEELVRDGADIAQIDRAMEAFGWPMGPAYLTDVVGLDVCCHASAVLAEGFPDRMALDFTPATKLLFEAGRLGQKSGGGYYQYATDEQGRPKRTLDESSLALIAEVVTGQRAFTDQEIVERMMLALCCETIRCVEDNIVDSPVAADMGLIWGIGFPRFRGGALRYVDSIGAQAFTELADKYADLGAVYQAPKLLREMAKNDTKFF